MTIKKVSRKQVYFWLFAVTAVSWIAAWILPISALMKDLASIPGVFALVGALFQLLRDEASNERQLLRDEAAHDRQILRDVLSTKASSLYPRRLEVIEELYRRLVTADRAMQELISAFKPAGSPPLDEQFKTAADAIDELMVYLDLHRVFFDEDTAEKVQACHHSMFDPAITYSVYLRLPVTDARGESERAAELKKAAEQVHAHVPDARKAVEASFRKLLGVEETPR